MSNANENVTPSEQGKTSLFDFCMDIARLLADIEGCLTLITLSQTQSVEKQQMVIAFCQQTLREAQPQLERIILAEVDVSKKE